MVHGESQRNPLRSHTTFTLSEHRGSEASLEAWFKEEFASVVPPPLQEPEVPAGDFIAQLLKGDKAAVAGRISGTTLIPVFRPFISSTFTDTAHERDLLIKLVYPFVARYATQLEVLFYQPSEMRWGIGPVLEKKHLTSATCMEELER